MGKMLLSFLPQAVPHSRPCSLRHPKQRNLRALSTLKPEAPIPWNFGYQCNERHLVFDESAARQLIRAYVARELETTVDVVHARLAQLAVLLPDIAGKLEIMKADIVLSLVRDVDSVAQRMVLLRDALPEVDVSAMVSGNLWLLEDRPTAEELKQSLENIREALPGANVEWLLEDEPRILMCDIQATLAEVQRLMPYADPADVITKHGGAVLTMKDAGMPPSLKIDDGIDAA